MPRAQRSTEDHCQRSRVSSVAPARERWVPSAPVVHDARAYAQSVRDFGHSHDVVDVDAAAHGQTLSGGCDREGLRMIVRSDIKAYGMRSK